MTAATIDSTMGIRWLAWTVVPPPGCTWLSVVADTDAGIAAVVLSFVIATGLTGVVLTSRLPHHPVGWLLQASACANAFGAVVVSYIEVATTVGDGLPLSPAMVWAGNIAFGIGTGICATWVLLLFPTGHLPSPRWRIVSWLAGVSLVALNAGVALGPDAFDGTPLTNPVTLHPDSLLLTALEGGGFYLFAATVLASVASLVVRYRRARDIEREQLKWVALSATIIGIVLGGTIAIGLFNGTANFNDDVENVAITLALAAAPCVDRRGDPALPAVRDRQAHQPHGLVCTAHRPAPRGVRRRHGPADPGVRRPLRPARRRRHPGGGRRVRPAAPPDPGRRGPPVQPLTLRRIL